MRIASVRGGPNLPMKDTVMRNSRILVTCFATLLPSVFISAAFAQTGQGGNTSASEQAAQTGGSPRAGTDSSADSGTRIGAGSEQGARSGSGDDTPTSEQFVKLAAQSNLAEIKVSQLAESKAQSAEVKKFAQQMIADHTKANAELTRIAMGKSVKVPDDTDMMHKASMKLLQTKSGASFDSAYMEQMDKDHQKAIELFQSASASPKVDKELQAFATKTLPKLQQHHHLVAQVDAKQSSSSAAAGTSSGGTTR
jgi:putative membrane protein